MTIGNLAAALLEAQKTVGALVKASRNDFGGFNYTSAEAVVTRSKEVLNENGLLVMTGDEHAHEVCGVPYIRTCYTLLHAPSGERMECARDWPIEPSKGQNLVRAAAVTNTSGLSYFLRDLLQIQRSEKDDLNHPDHDKRRGAPKEDPMDWPADPSPALLRADAKMLIARLPAETQAKAEEWFAKLPDDPKALMHAISQLEKKVSQ